MSVKTKTYRFARQFGQEPGGRYREEGPYSGQEFFETVLRAHHDRGEHTILDLTDAMGFATSFLDGAFGEFAATYGKAAFYESFTLRIEDDPTLGYEIERALERGDATRPNR